MLVMIDQGMRNGGGFADALKDKFKKGSDGEFTLADGTPNTMPILMALRWLLDMTFFFIIVLILMNVLFGIIIDSFGALREEKNFQKDDSTNVC